MGVGCEDVVLGFLLVTRGGGLLKHALGVMLLAWRRMMLAGAAAFVAAVLVGEMAAVVASGRIPPPLMAQVVIGIFASVVAYGIVVTVFLEELVQGLISTIRIIEGDAAAGARAAAVIAEREAGEVGTGLLRLFGGHRKPGFETTQVQPVAPPANARAATRGGAPGETEQAIAATEEFVTTAPRPRVNAQPVRADQLPRIGWAAEQDEAEETAPRAQAVRATAPIPPLEQAGPSQASATSHVTPPPARQPDDSPPPQEPAPPEEAAPATRPLPTDDAETWSPPAPLTVLPLDAQDVGEFGAPGRPTRPLSRPNSQPLEPADDTPGGRSIWGRISQAPEGKIDEPGPEGDAEETGDTPQAEPVRQDGDGVAGDEE